MCRDLDIKSSDILVETIKVCSKVWNSKELVLLIHDIIGDDGVESQFLYYDCCQNIAGESEHTKHSPYIHIYRAFGPKNIQTPAT